MEVMQRAHEADIRDLKALVFNLREKLQQARDALEAEHQRRLASENKVQMLTERLFALTNAAREQREKMSQEFVHNKTIKTKLKH